MFDIRFDEGTMYAVLKQINNNESVSTSPNKEYLKCLHTVGIINMGWEYSLTALGKSILKLLENKYNPW